MGQGHPWCVAWVGSGVALPTELSDAFGRRSIEILRAESDYQVLAIAGERKRRGERGAFILTLVEPDRLGNVAGVIAACERRWKNLAVWEFRAGANPSLRVHVQEEVKPSAPKDPIPVVRSGIAPKLRLVDEGVERRSENADGILTHEELMMLLGEAPGEERHA